MAHQPVLLQEVIAGLKPRPDGIYVDATLNRGGHARGLCQLLGASGRLVGIDADAEAVAEARANLRDCPGQVNLVVRNFRELEAVLDELGVKQIDGALFDLGLSSDQLERSGRGFSFEREEPLRMTFAAEATPGRLSAYEIVNTWRESSLADIIHGFGEEWFARRIAQAIVETRRHGEIKTTTELVEIIRGAVPGWYTHRRLHFATKTFQALRMAVNDELGALTAGLEAAFRRLAPHGRLAVISFHSLEARLVKEKFRDWTKAGQATLVAKKAIKPTRSEILNNPRARSAQLRLVEKL